MWAEYSACIWEEINVYSSVLGKSYGKRPLRRARCRWADNIKMNIREECHGM
jgi:hypothetical protein